MAAEAAGGLPVGALRADQLWRRCAVEAFGFSTTDELRDDATILGQQRAVEALRFGIGIAEPGYNLFAMGPEGVGRRTLARRFLEEAAASKPVPRDWCYVFNFELPQRPRAIALPPGRGFAFKRDMARLVEDLRTGIPAAFEADEYRTRRQEIEGELSERQERALGAVGEHAAAQKIGLLRTPGGFGFAPLEGDDVMPPARFQALPDEERKRLQQAIETLQAELEGVIQQVPVWRREAQHKLRELDRAVTRTAINSLIDELRSAYAPLPDVVRYLGEVQEDVLDHAQYFQPARDGERSAIAQMVLGRGEAAESPLRRYAVNLLVDHAATTAAPFVYEDHPTHDNLIGRVEHVAHMGALTSDFTLITAGALHRANGGYLMLDAVKLLTQPLAWDALKRALLSGEVRTEPLAYSLGLLSTQGLQPEPIPLALKVVLVGPRHVHALLHAYDPEFPKLFKVVVDFAGDVERTPAAELDFAAVVAGMARRRRLRPFEAAAVGRMVEQASRAAGSAEKLAIAMHAALGLAQEADYWAGVRGRTTVAADDVEAALDARRRRIDDLPTRLREEVLRGRILVDTGGSRVGQANGLAVAEIGGERFGLPVRITARVRMGGGVLLDIERESKLGGSIHSKGVMIIAGYLAGRYAAGGPLALSATLVFEQSYGLVDGDSASATELCALLSALADVPLSNAIAVTGSVNQHGDVQAIGGVNEKIEGYFDLCSARGLAGGQGVLIPAANAPQLMLKREVVEAVAGGRFAIHAVATVDQGLEILTGMAAGARDAVGGFPRGSLNARIEERLAGFAERARVAAEVPARRLARRRRER